MIQNEIEKIRKQFPFLEKKIKDKKVVYLDNAATSQKPKSVINAIVNYYTNYNSNVHRGAHYTSRQATELFENSRKKVKSFINAQYDEEIIFTKGTTDSINILANSFCNKYINKGDNIILGFFEHHSNMVPWQILSKQYNFSIKYIPINNKKELDLNKLNSLIDNKTKLISVNHISNSLGTFNDIKKITEISHNKNIPIIVDGAQSVPHIKIDIQKLGVDFFCFSGHKMYAATGIGVLYGKKKYLDELEPIFGGGEMIKTVDYNKVTYNAIPFKFEPGTPNIEGAISLKYAIEFLQKIGINKIFEHEHKLTEYTFNKLKKIKGIRFFGSEENYSSVVSFLIDGVHPYDLGMFLDNFGIAIRTGHHCSQPVMNYFNISGTNRISFAVYNTFEEIDYTIEAIKKSLKILKK